MVKYWMHTGFLNVKGEKMSNPWNFIHYDFLQNTLQMFSGFCTFKLTTESPIDFSQEILHQSQQDFKEYTNYRNHHDY